MRLHPIMYVSDQYAERDFYVALGFQVHYEGPEFPGFIALRHGEAVFGLQRASDGHTAYGDGLRWQFELTADDEVEQIADTCRNLGLAHHVEQEIGGDAFRTTIVTVQSPAGVTVWFEGPNQAAENA